MIINKKEFMGVFVLISYLALYILHVKFFFILLPIAILIYILISLKLSNIKLFIFFYLYMTFILISSFLYNDLTILLMDSKFYIMILIFYIFYILSYKRILKIDDFLNAVSILIVLIGIFGILSIYSGVRFGNRGDFGNALVILLPILLYFNINNKITKKEFYLFIILNLIVLVILQGRTALIAYVFSISLIYIYRKKLNLHISKNIMYILFILSFLAAFKIFMYRAGVNNENLEHEARYLAYFIFIEILQHIDLQHLLFGFGFGAYFDNFADNISIASAHVAQIKNSSGVGHYISWGFHNNIIRMFLLLGLIGLFLLYIWQISLFYITKSDYIDKRIIILKTILKIIFYSTLLLSFSNGIYGTTLVSSLLFSFQGLLYGEIKYLRNHVK